MTTDSPVIRVSDFEVDVVRKDIKNLHLAVYPPFGRVRVAAPHQLDDEAIRLAVVTRLSWVTKQRKKMRDQPRQTSREMINGETHYIWGRPYRLKLVEDGARLPVHLTASGLLELHVPAGADHEARARRLEAWYRRQLSAAIPEVVSKWASILEVDEPSWGIRKMKTKWGTCKRDQGRIWLNLELVQKSPTCLEYIVVHEMVHFLERNHSERFYSLMTTFMPKWMRVRETLNATLLGHQEWKS